LCSIRKHVKILLVFEEIISLGGEITFIHAGKQTSVSSPTFHPFLSGLWSSFRSKNSNLRIGSLSLRRFKKAELRSRMNPTS
jgi:hypothetical protein